MRENRRAGRGASGRLGVLVLTALVGLSCRRVEPPAAGPAEPAPEAQKPPVITTEGGIEMVQLPAGRFTMGSDRGEDDEAPVHEVSIDAFLIDRREITQEQWAKIARGNPWLPRDPSHFKGPDRPVEMISWDIAALFCNERSRKEGLQPCYDEDTGRCDFEADGYRLPTEAEWEYAARAGTETDYHFGSDTRPLRQHAWHADNASKKTHPVGQKKPNPWGLFDMHGNVAEWCNDVYDENYYQKSPAKNPRGPAEGEPYVLRGGAWNCTADACRSARRVGEDPGIADACFARDAIGLRCVRRAPASGLAPNAADSEDQEADDPGAQNPADPGGQNAADPKQEAANPDPNAAKAEQEVAASDQTARQVPGDDPPSKTGFLYGDIYLKHKTDPGHPERPERLAAILKRLEETSLLSQLVRLEPAPAALEWITAVHTREYVARVKRTCEGGFGYLDSPDTPVSKDSYEAAVAAVGGVLAAVDAVVAGKIRNAFCAVRPPGHHALADEAMGFCLFNNVAIAARYLQKKHKLAKILIVDWDVHHGNGTQAAFYDDPTVLYFSVHQYPFYPGTGSRGETGSGKGIGLTLNAPLPAGSGDEEFQQALAKVLKPAALDFDPDFVLVSAGFDAHEHDLLGGMRVTAEGFAELTRMVQEIADRCCEGRLVSVLEGGYDLEGLADSTEAHLRVLMQ